MNAPRSLLLAGLLVMWGCRLTEVVTPAGEDILVVEAVLIGGTRWQSVLLHRTLLDGTVRGEPDAVVTLTSTAGGAVRLEPVPIRQCVAEWLLQRFEALTFEPTCFQGEFSVRPGETYELHVETPAGERVRGRTTVPGVFHIVAPEHGMCELPPRTNFPIVWSPSAGSWAYIASMEVWGLRRAGTWLDAPDFLQLTGLAVSRNDTSIVFPREFGVFDRFEMNQQLLIALQEGLPDGASTNVVVAAADRNYVNGVRGGAFNPSGAVRISSVVGDGVGVFASVLPRTLSVLVGDEEGLPSCLAAAPRVSAVQELTR